VNDAPVAKVASILKCLNSVQEIFESGHTFRNNVTTQDAVLLNLQRACEASIATSNRSLREKCLGLPKSARESFELPSKNGLIQAGTARCMRNMIGFRNVAIHDYQALSLDIIDSVMFRLDGFKNFVSAVDNDSDRLRKPTVKSATDI
jgi:uncharacterized protein YutE (UPF0331/DUF86 family)